MAGLQCPSDDELPSLEAIIGSRKAKPADKQPSRRSPRKHNPLGTTAETSSIPDFFATKTLTATSMQTRLSPVRPPTTRRSPLRTLKQPQAGACLSLDNIPVLPRGSTSQDKKLLSAGQEQAAERPVVNRNSLSHRLSRLSVNNETSDTEPDSSLLGRKSRNPSSSKSVMSLMTEAARAPVRSLATTKQSSPQKISKQTLPTSKVAASRFILGEARCNDDLADSDAENDGGEEDDTDLSGFIVDDDAEISFHDSMQSGSDDDSEEERRRRRQTVKNRPRRRLQRGRKQVLESEDELIRSKHNPDKDLADALQGMKIGASDHEHIEVKEVEVIDLTSPASTSHEHEHSFNRNRSSSNRSAEDDLYKDLKAMRLSPPTKPRNMQPPTKRLSFEDLRLVEVTGSNVTKSVEEPKFTTPPATPPRSPTKLRSPSKQLLSPSKRTDLPARSPSRPSLDAFWDHNVINEFHDQYSPKRAPLTSPRKIMDRFHLWSDKENDSVAPGSEDSSDSLPSPCESPSKPRKYTSPLKGPEKAERKRIQEAKKAELERKKQFEATKDQLAHELLGALDKHVTNSKLSAMTANTGGVQIIWSKNLRSTAGRAQWRRTTTKATNPSTKSVLAVEGRASGSIVQHFAKIELATKVIDRPERLVSTLTHEFCHLANYMVSGIRDQPHGASFHQWGHKCIKWLREESGRADWKHAEVATKHSYEIDFKYLWICTGRPRTMAMDVLNLVDEEGCGAEYGRHSKSVDTEKHRCGRCKGRLVQVRPKPRASPTKTSPVKNTRAQRNDVSKSETVTETIEIVELSD